MQFSCVYLVTNKPRGVLYIGGVTTDLVRRISEHRQSLIPGFSKRYDCTRLVWYEVHEDVRVAIQREKSLKRWYREWKIALVEESNPTWRDLFFEMSGLEPGEEQALRESFRPEVLGSRWRSPEDDVKGSA